MNTFFIILHKLVDIKNIQYSSPYDYEYWNKVIMNDVSKYDKQNKLFILFYVHGFFFKDHLKNGIGLYKFKGLQAFLRNPFVNDECKERFLVTFAKAQRLLYGFKRLVQKFRYKRAKTQIQTDLCMSEIKETDRNVFVVLQNKSKYLFTVSDLSKIICTGLMKMSFFFLEPSFPKNPFNNIPFTNSSLISFYFFIRERNFNMPLLFDAFFRSNLSLKQFVYDYESMIKTEALKNYVNTTPYSVLQYEIIPMLQMNHRWTKKLRIHPEFPEDKLVAIFRPYLHLYYIYKYFTMGAEKTSQSCDLLIEKLKQFVQYNPKFGRRIVKIERKLNFDCSSNNAVSFGKKPRYIKVVTESFNMDYIDFHKRWVRKREYDSDEEEDNDASSYTEEALFYGPDEEDSDSVEQDSVQGLEPQGLEPQGLESQGLDQSPQGLEPFIGIPSHLMEVAEEYSL